MYELVWSLRRAATVSEHRFASRENARSRCGQSRCSRYFSPAWNRVPEADVADLGRQRREADNEQGESKHEPLALHHAVSDPLIVRVLVEHHRVAPNHTHRTS